MRGGSLMRARWAAVLVVALIAACVSTTPSVIPDVDGFP
jgi:hypothetical protein